MQRKSSIWNRIGPSQVDNGNDAVLLGKHAVFASGCGGPVVLDVSSASFPIEVASCHTPGEAQKVGATGNDAHVGDGAGGLPILRGGGRRSTARTFGSSGTITDPEDPRNQTLSGRLLSTSLLQSLVDHNKVLREGVTGKRR